MELFSARVCPFAHRTRLVLFEKGIEFEHTEIDLKDPPQRFLDLSPYGKVPCLIDAGAVLYESAIVNEYLDETRPEPALMPRDPLARARVRIWIDYCDQQFLDDLYALLRSQDRPTIATLGEKFESHLTFIEHQGLRKLSATGPYWLGAEPTLLDFAYYPFFERLPAWAHYRGVAIPPQCTRLRDWLRAMAGLESVRAHAGDADYYVHHYQGYAKAVLHAA